MMPESTSTHAQSSDIWDITFWQALSDVQEDLAGGVALRQPRAPLLLANAVWQPDAAAVADIRGFYEPHNIHAGVVTTQLEPPLVTALQDAGFAPEMRFTLSPVSNDPDTHPDIHPDMHPDIHVEQVSWTEAGRMGGVLAMAYDYLTFDTALGMLVSRTMQALPNLQAYLAFAGEDAPSGAMLVMAKANALRAIFLGGKPDAKDALTARLASEAKGQEKNAEVLEYTPIVTGLVTGLVTGQLEPDKHKLIYWRHPD